VTTSAFVARHWAWLLILLLGCAKQYDIQSSGGNAPSIRLAAEVSILVAVPEDGGYGVETVEGSGRMTARAVAAAFSGYSDHVKSAEVHVSGAESLEAARSRDFQYLVVPKILRWKERLKKEYGKPDGVVVNLKLIDVKSEEVVDVTILKGKSLRIPPVSPEERAREDGRAQPFLVEPLPRYVESLFVR
jgi:hypothetical protein